MKCEEVKPLMADYWAGGLEGTQELAYEEHLESCGEACRTEVMRLDRLWRGLELLPREEPAGSLRGRFYDTLKAYRQGMDASPRGRWPIWQMAAAALLVIGIAAGYLLRSSQGGGEVAKLREEMAGMRQLVALSLLQQQSASARLSGVSWAYRAEPDNREVLDALVTAINHDSNVNVRLAAVDALHAFAQAPAARRAMVEALPRQDASIVQVALIDLLVDIKDRDAAGDLRKLADTGTVNDGVKQRALWALDRLQGEMQ